MADQEPLSRPEMDQGIMDAQQRSQERHYQRFGLDLSANGVSYLINDEKTAPDLGRDLTTFYFLCQISPHGGTEISGWQFESVLQSMSNRTLENQWLRMSTSKIDRETYGELGQLNNRRDLESAMMKQGEYKYLDVDRKKHPEGRDGYSADLTDNEMIALGRLERNLEAVKNRCLTCGDVGKTLNDWVELKMKQTLLDSARRDSDLSVDNLEMLQDELRATVPMADNLNRKIRMADLMMKDGSKQAETEEWVNLLKAAVGVNEVFAVCKQWLTNQSDLDPISKLWVYMGRMAELHPSALEAMAREWPSFNDAFIGMAALGSGKYALGSNGEKYVSGKYGLGYVDIATGKVVDVDAATTRDAWGRMSGLVPGIQELGLNQIWVPGRGAVDVVDNKINLGSVTEPRMVNIFSESLLFLKRKDASGRILNDIRLAGGDVKLKDYDVSGFLADVLAFVKGKNPNTMGEEMELTVEMAREIYELSMLSNWNGIARDSQGRPYYTLDNNPLTMSSNPESMAVKMGSIAMGTDESSLFPYWNGGDWGKLTQTRAKQLSELGKGRKHGLYAIIPFLPENLAKPMISQKIIDRVMNGEVRMEEVFKEMNSNEQFKTYWLDIYKGCAVYEFISSMFIGEKDPGAAGEDLVKLLSQTRVWEGITKDIDLSLYWVDPNEAARLKVNIVLGALATVSKDFLYEDYMGIMTGSTPKGRLNDYVSEIDAQSVKGNTKQEELYVVLRQLVDSRFIGGEDELKIILERLGSYRKGTSPLGFSLAEFKGYFGDDSVVKKRFESARAERKAAVLARQTADGKQKL